MRRLACLLAILVVFAACNKRQTPTDPSPLSRSTFVVTFATDPAPPVETENTTFKASLADSGGKPVSGATVALNLKMATMDMGKNEVTLAEKQPGAYEGTGKFTMAGPWKVIVTARQGDMADQQTFDVVAHRKQ